MKRLTLVVAPATAAAVGGHVVAPAAAPAVDGHGGLAGHGQDLKEGDGEELKHGKKSIDCG